MAHLEYFGDNRRERRDGDTAILCLGLLGGQQQHPQSDAADINDIGKVQHQRIATGSALRQVLYQRRLERLGVGMVKPPLYGEDPNRPQLTG